MNRRTFVATALSASRVFGANERVRIGLIGCGGRGRYVARFMSESPHAQFVAAADVYQPLADETRAWAGSDARAFQDFRKLLELRDVDAVLIATPDHWHAGATVLACEAGKHVYVEKPLAHNIREGRAIAEAARKHNRIVQSGTQQRSSPHFAEAAEIVQSGKLGEVRFVRVWNYSNMLPNGIGHAPDSDPPQGLDWDMYLGPAPKRNFNPKRFRSSFRWFWDYAGGTITDFGTHRFDTVHQIMGADKPRKVSASGGRFMLRDAGEMPDLMQVTYEYPGFLMHYEACNFNSHGLGGRTPGMKYYHGTGADNRPHGMAFYGSNGALFADRLGYEIYPEPKSSLERKSMNTTDATSTHAKRFVDVIRNSVALNAPAEVGHRAAIIGHLGNIALKTGRTLEWNAETEKFVNDAEANRMLGRTGRKQWDFARVIG
jgi:predicted dehydrogenase